MLPRKKKYNIQDEMSLFQDYSWVRKVIASCKTYEQHNHSDCLILFLENKYKNKIDSNLLETILNKLTNYWILRCEEVSHEN